jgi:hypothetical protein
MSYVISARFEFTFTDSWVEGAIIVQKISTSGQKTRLRGSAVIRREIWGYFASFAIFNEKIFAEKPFQDTRRYLPQSPHLPSISNDLFIYRQFDVVFHICLAYSHLLGSFQNKKYLPYSITTVWIFMDVHKNETNIKRRSFPPKV